MGLLMPDDEDELLRRYASNPIGTSRMGEQSMYGSDGRPFDPLVGTGEPGQAMLTEGQREAIKQGSIELFQNAAMAAPGVRGPQAPGAPGGPVTAARVRTRSAAAGPDGWPVGYRPGGGPGGVRGGAPYTSAPDPEAGLLGPAPVAPEPPLYDVGHNQSPYNIKTGKPKAGMTVGKMGANSDTQLADIGIPAYHEIVPSLATGPLDPESLKSGSPVRPGQVMDLSNTWQDPRLPGSGPADRIDPNAGKRRGLPEHIQQITTDPELRAKLRTAAEAGIKAGGAYWYNAEPLRAQFISELGPQEGAKQFDRYMSLISAVSAGSEVGQNVRTASYYLNRERAGDPVQHPKTEGGPEKPYGHKLQNTQFWGYRDITDPAMFRDDAWKPGKMPPDARNPDPDVRLGSTKLDSQYRPKRWTFGENLSGSQEGVTVDKHNMRLIGMLSQNPNMLKTTEAADADYEDLGVKKGDKRNWQKEVLEGRIPMSEAIKYPHMWKDVPEAAHYGALEKMQQDLAKEMGISPAQLQAALWVGGGRVTGLKSLPTSFMGIVENRLARTAAERGIEPRDALKEFIRGGRALLTPAGLTVGAGLGAGGMEGLLGPGTPDERRY
jgi:hypothetical protein